MLHKVTQKFSPVALKATEQLSRRDVTIVSTLSPRTKNFPVQNERGFFSSARKFLSDIAFRREASYNADNFTLQKMESVSGLRIDAIWAKHFPKRKERANSTNSRLLWNSTDNFFGERNRKSPLCKTLSKSPIFTALRGHFLGLLSRMPPYRLRFWNLLA